MSSQKKKLENLKSSVASLNAADSTELLQFMLTLQIYQPNGKRNMIRHGMEWFYLDPHDSVQGPFSTEVITAWFHKGFFTLDLKISDSPTSGNWSQLRRVFPHLVIKKTQQSLPYSQPPKRFPDSPPQKRKEDDRKTNRQRDPAPKQPSSVRLSREQPVNSRKRKASPARKAVSNRAASPKASAGASQCTFEDLGLDTKILKALKSEGYVYPTPIQERTIPLLLQGRDVLGIARTGSGKTCAFITPILHFLNEMRNRPNRPKILALILSPTRELAAQIDERVNAYSKVMRFVRHCVIFGGVNQNRQVADLKKGVHVLTACPGRLLDLMNQGFIDLGHIEFFVLDEADRMLDMGFIHDIRRVLKVLPEKRQNLLFSATFPDTIAKLGSSFLTNPARVDVASSVDEAPDIQQNVMFVTKADKSKLLTHIMKSEKIDCAIVFTRTKHGANRLARHLANRGIDATAIHGNKSQNARTLALAEFKNGTKSVLVATDVASRGIDVEDVSHVFNFDLPNETESYVHRIGRTARAGRSGVATAFCSENEGPYLKAIEKLIGEKIKVIRDHPFHLEGVDLNFAENPPHKKQPRSNGGRNNNNNNSNRSNGRGGGRGRGRGGGNRRGGGRRR